jgi:gamma-glutamyltranspeptidase / glutathione hydrolase
MRHADWILDRHEAHGARGMVAAKHPIAAGVGADVLASGGNAVDAAVAAAFAVGVVEPFMSGIGGGGFIVAHLPERRESVVVDYSMIAPRRATPEMYRVLGGSDRGLFGWPAVEDVANIVGHRAVAVPGTVAGLAMALERYGTIPLPEALAPAIRLAEEGFPVNWHTTLYVAIDLPNLTRFAATRDIFTVDGNPPSPLPGVMRPLRQPDLAGVLRAIAENGPDIFYAGWIAEAIVGEMAASGGLIDLEDLGGYRARILEPLVGSYRGRDVLTTPGASGGPTVLETLNLMERAPLGEMEHNSPEALHVIADACRQAFVDRFAYLADPEFVPVPVDALVSKAYAAEISSRFKPGRARSEVTAGSRERLAVDHDLAVSEPGYGRLPMTTTHLSVMDRAGNAVSLTQTLLSGWGSRVTVPGTGILLNNGMMWFDPEPGRPNSVAGGKRPLANMAPVVMLEDGESFLSLGAMGGRRILNAVPQIASAVIDQGMGIQQAITSPRIDCSTPVVEASSRIDARTLETLESMGYPIRPVEEDVLSFEFGSPVGVLRRAGQLSGGANPYYPASARGLD